MNEIHKILNDIRPEADFQSSSNFAQDGLLDSFDVVTLVSELDKTFQISIQGTDILPENFKNIDSIATLLKKYGARV